jgi:dihydrofolate reductase
MAKLIYSMLTSLDGYTEDAQGDFGWGVPEDEEVHSYVNELASSLGTYLYGRRMYETMVFTSVTDLRRKLMRYIKQYKKTAKPVRWAYADPTRRIA